VAGVGWGTDPLEALSAEGADHAVADPVALARLFA
jgi:hypothetical protein